MTVHFGEKKYRDDSWKLGMNVHKDVKNKNTYLSFLYRSYFWFFGLKCSRNIYNSRDDSAEYQNEADNELFPEYCPKLPEYYPYIFPNIIRIKKRSVFFLAYQLFMLQVATLNKLCTIEHTYLICVWVSNIDLH